MSASQALAGSRPFHEHMGIIEADGSLAQSGKVGANGGSSICFALEIEMWPYYSGQWRGRQTCLLDCVPHGLAKIKISGIETFDIGIIRSTTEKYIHVV